jgi:S-adenosylmethionine decarboxylase
MNMKKKTKHPLSFGLHLMLEAYNCPIEVLDDANVVYKFLDELPEKLGMKKLIKPYVIHAEGNSKRDPGGWTGFVIIQESHVSLHTFVKRKFVTIDVYSCKDFDTDMAIGYIKKKFQTDDVEFIIEERGKRYPENDLE